MLQPGIYQPLDYFVLRTPALPVERYQDLSSSEAEQDYKRPIMLAAADPAIRRALRVATTSLDDAMEGFLDGSSHRDAYLSGKVLRYLIRMSTRPTPFGMFSGVALGSWTHRTDIELTAERKTRMRPDMTWLLARVLELERRPEVRRLLRVFANSALSVRGHRIWLPHRVAAKDNDAQGTTSIRATPVVLEALELAQRPIRYAELIERLARGKREHLREQVERLLEQLWRQGYLLTELRLPLTNLDPLAYLVEHLRQAGAPEGEIRLFEELKDAFRIWDAASDSGVKPAYDLLSSRVLSMTGTSVAEDTTAFQVDMATTLQKRGIHARVAEEAAHAAELLLRLSSAPKGPGYMEGYRKAFVARYGFGTRTPLLDAVYDLGLPIRYATTASESPANRLVERDRLLWSFASEALQNGEHVLKLNEQDVRKLETWSSSSVPPSSLEINVLLASASAEAVDEGRFQLVIGPNLGAGAAGRSLARFADLLGEEATSALCRTARMEEKQDPEKVWAEVVYQPLDFHAANVVVRPPIRTHEFLFDLAPGVPLEKAIPIRELAVSIDLEQRFHLWWTTHAVEVKPCAGHMLNNIKAPSIPRLLVDLSQDQTCAFIGFDWGRASALPRLPRVQHGRVVLSLAQWRIDEAVRTRYFDDAQGGIFSRQLSQWRERWKVPRYVYLAAGDNRLLLDLEHPSQSQELSKEIGRIQGSRHVVIQEVLPALEECWISGPGGRYYAELVIPLTLRKEHWPAKPPTPSPMPPARVGQASAPEISDRLRLPGSEWLFLKLYTNGEAEDRFIANEIASFADAACTSGMAVQWFFMRYSDPDPHVRLRFFGSQDIILKELIPAACDWGSQLLAKDVCRRVAIDTYDREIERYGGLGAMQAAESVFAIDSVAVAALLGLLAKGLLLIDRRLLAVLSVEDLLGSFGLDDEMRMKWYRRRVPSPKETSDEFRQLKGSLRPMAGNPCYLLAQMGGRQLQQLLAARRAQIQAVAQRLVEMEAGGRLAMPLEMVLDSFVHMHLNRLWRIDASYERRLYGLAMRTRESLKHAPIVETYLRRDRVSALLHS